MNDIEQLKRYDNEKVKYRVREYNPTSAQQGGGDNEGGLEP
jgi:hypothetical protein